MAATLTPPMAAASTPLAISPLSLAETSTPVVTASSQAPAILSGPTSSGMFSH